MARGRRGPIDWYSPDPRAILPLDPPGAFHVPHGLRRSFKKRPYVVTFDRAFEQVIRGCAAPGPGPRASTWISRPIIVAYTQLHHAGLAHSVEAWFPPDSPNAPPDLPPDLPPRLAGGLYGVALGGAFFGESMFSLAPDASKICLVYLVEHLRARGYILLDTQIANPHMQQFGVIEIARSEYLARLEQALNLEVSWQDAM
jgi:leucyl/phenylalanyl-tRNA--protein transferase